MTTQARASMPTAQTAHTRRERGDDSAPRPGHILPIDKRNNFLYYGIVNTGHDKANK